MVGNIAELPVSNRFGLCDLDKPSNVHFKFFFDYGMVEVNIDRYS